MPERAGQKQPGGQGTGGEEDARGQKNPEGQDSQPPWPLKKKPERQAERNMSTALLLVPAKSAVPPPNRAMFEADVAARPHRVTVRDAVVHNPEVTLKISTTLEILTTLSTSTTPPPNRARFGIEVAARYCRPTLRHAVVHNPEVALKISTTLEL
jgi:hypothetical protein